MGGGVSLYVLFVSKRRVDLLTERYEFYSLAKPHLLILL